MELIELHILQSFPVTCLNRDDLGAPKSAVFGGVQRARVSSQSGKRAIRKKVKEDQPELFAGQRTRYIISALKDSFKEKGQDEKRASVLAEKIAHELGKLDSVEKGNVKTLLFFSKGEIDNVADAMLGFDFTKDIEIILNQDAEEKKIEKSKKSLANLAKKAAKSLKDNAKDTADIAIFGRMVADDHTLMLEGAGLFSHALSTHQVSSEIDFFSAVDDAKPEDSESAGHIGTLEFNSACYYRYIGINLDLLKDNDHLSHFTDQDRNIVIETFLKAAVLAVPEARKNSMSGLTLPSYVLGLRKHSQPLSLANAFETPIKSSAKGYIEPSIERMNEHFAQLKNIYNLTATKEVNLPEKDLDVLVKELLLKE